VISSFSARTMALARAERAPDSLLTSGSQPEVAAGGGGQGFEWSDIAVDEDGDVVVSGLGGDPVQRDSGQGRGGGVAGA
jgi:hypothetical protein